MLAKNKELKIEWILRRNLKSSSYRNQNGISGEIASERYWVSRPKKLKGK